MISRVNVELRKRQADGGDLLLNPKTVSEWFTKGRVPQDFRLVWAFTEALLAAAGGPPADPAKRRAWREGQYARCKGTWEAARDAALAAAANAASGSGHDVAARMRSHSGTAVASVPMEAVIRDPQSLLADVLEYGFHGRDWLVRRINTFLDRQQCGFVWVEAEAGVGKTAVAAYLVRERGWLSHFARYSGGRSVRGGLQNLAAQLVERFGLGEVAPRGMLPEWAFTPEGFETLLERAAIRAQATGQKLVLVVDGADEAECPEGTLPWGLPRLLPQGVFVVGTYRTGHPPGWCHSKQVVLRIDSLGRDNQADVALFLDVAVHSRMLADRLAEAQVEAPVFASRLGKQCRGVWVYLRYVLDEIRYGLRNADDLESLPSDLASFYTAHLVQWREGPEWADGLLEVLAVLAVAGEPLTPDTLARLTGIAEERVKRWCDYLLRPFLAVTPEPPRRFEIYHASMREYLSGATGGDDVPDEHRAWAQMLGDAAVTARSRIADYYLHLFGELDNDLSALAENAAAGMVDGGYPLRHLAAHLVGAGRIADLRRLLDVEHSIGSGRAFNVWFAAHDSADTLDSYLDDVASACRHYQTRTDRALARGLPAPSLSDELRCILISGSVISLTDKLPAKLLARLLMSNVWMPERALAHARRLTIPVSRVEALTAIAPVLPPDLRSQAFDYALSAIAAIADVALRADALTAVAPYLSPHHLVPALSIATAISDEGCRAEALASLAPHLPPDQLEEALIAVTTMDDYDARGEGLAGVAPYLSADQLELALAAALEMFRECPRAKALSALAPYLDLDQLSRALDAATAIEEIDYRAQVLIGVAPHMPANRRSAILAEALDAASQIAYGFGRAKALANLAPCLTQDQIAKAFSAAAAIIGTDARGRALAGLAPYLSDDQLKTGLQGGVAGYRPEDLTGLFPYLSAEQRSAILAEAVAAASDNVYGPNWHNAEILAGLAPHIASDQLAQVLNAACTIPEAYIRSWVLARIAPYLTLTPELLACALDAAAAIASDDDRAKALDGLAPYLTPELLACALDAAAAIASDDDRAKALDGLAPYLTPELLAPALHAAAAITDHYADASALIGLGPDLPASQRSAAFTQAWTAARLVIDPVERANALTGLVRQSDSARRRALVAEALAAIVKIRWMNDRARPLRELAPYLNSDQLVRARIAGAELTSDRARVMFSLISRMSPGQIAHILYDVIEDKYGGIWRVRTLVDLAPHLSSAQLEQALTAAAAITGNDIGEALAGLVPYLSPAQLQQVLTIAIASVSEVRAEVLTAIVPFLPRNQRPDVLRQALDAAASIYRKDNRSHALSQLARHLPVDQLRAVMTQALDLAGEIEYEVELAAVLTKLAPYLSTRQRARALRYAIALTEEMHRADALAGLAPYLSTDQLTLALDAAVKLTEERMQAIALVGMAPYLAPSQLAKTVVAIPQRHSEVLEALIARASDLITMDSGLAFAAVLRTGLQAAPRDTCLRVIGGCTRALQGLTGPDGLKQIAMAVDDTRRWWP